MRLMTIPLVALFWACGGDKSTTTGETGATDADADTDADSDADADADADADTDPTGCTALVDGAWSADGSCFGMTMGATLTMDATACSFTLTNWDMMMSAPTGGSVSGTDVTLTGAGWTTCTGTASADGTTIDGSCASDGCAFTMASGG